VDFDTNGGVGVDPVPPGGVQQVVDSAHDQSPDVSQELRQRLAQYDAEQSTKDNPTSDDPTKPGTLSSLWQRIKKSASHSEQVDNELGNAALRGVAKAVDAGSNSIVGAAVGISKKTGLYKVGRSPEEQDAFLKWWDKPTKDANPFQIGEERINRWLGPAQGGLPGFVENASQFATGLALTRKILPISAGVKGTLVAGAATDASFFDPYQKRLSNMIQNGPEWMRNPLTDMLQEKDDDSEPVARFKAAAEGFLTSATIESVLHGVRAMRGGAKSVAEGVPEVKPDPSEVVEVKPTEDGKFTVQPVAKDVYHGTSRTFDAIKPGKSGQFGPAIYTTESADEAAKYAGSGGRVIPLRIRLNNPFVVNADVSAGKPITWFQKHGFNLPEDPFNTAAQQRLKDAGHDGIIASQPEVLGANADNTPILGKTQTHYVAFEPTSVQERLAVEKTPDTPIFDNAGDAEQAAASINYFHKNAVKEAGVVDPTTLRAWKDRLNVYSEETDTRSLDELRDQYALNIKYDSSPEELLNVVKSMVDVMPEPQEIARGRSVPWAETAQAARSLGLKGMSEDQVVEHAARLWGHTSDLPKQLYASKEVMADMGKSIYKLSQMVDANPENGVAASQLSNSLESLMQFHAYFSGAKSDVARSLNVLKAPVGEAMDELITKGEFHRAPAGGAFSGMSRSEIASMMRMVHLSGGDPAEIIAQMKVPRQIGPLMAKTSDPTTLQRIGNYATTLRIEAMLSGPKTHVTNMVSNAMAAMQRPVEYWWAGVRHGNSSLRQFGGDLFGGLLKDHQEALSAAKKSFLDGVNILDPGNTHTGQGVMGPAQGLSFLRPSRFLMASDEMFKQLNYRSHVRAQILQAARQEGVTDAGELAQRVASDLPFAFTPDGGAVIPQAMEYTRYSTFTNELEYGLGKKMQELSQESVWFRNVMPFVRTPTNIFRYAWERTPLLNALNKDFRKQLSGAMGEDARQIAVAKSELGTALYTTATMMALSGHISGRGPSDPDLRKQWIAAGNQPYSMRVPGTNQWVSYRRLDPTFAPLGIAADLVSMSGEMSQDQHDNLWASAAASITANLASKTYMQGLVEFMDAVASGQGHLFTKFGENVAGSFIPNALRQADPNDTYRETYGLLDEMSSRIPWLSQGLEPRRNILGEKIMRPPGYFNRTINPFTVAPGITQNSTEDELLKLGKAFSMPSTTLANGSIDLTDRKTFDERKNQSPYDRMLELMGTGFDGAPGLRKQLEDLMKDPQWKSLSSDDAYGPGGMKFKLASDVIHSMQEASQAKLFEEYPKLARAYEQAMNIQGAGLGGGKPAADSVMKSYTDLFTTRK
jgi:hypothetical protein